MNTVLHKSRKAERKWLRAKTAILAAVVLLAALPALYAIAGPATFDCICTIPAEESCDGIVITATKECPSYDENGDPIYCCCVGLYNSYDECYYGVTPVCCQPVN